MPGPAPFPQLPSGNNPYVGAAAAAGAGAARLLAALEETAAQQKQFAYRQQQQGLKAQADREFQLRQAGYTPFLQTTGRDSSGLLTRTEQQIPPGGLYSDEFGRKWLPPAAKPDATPQQTFTDTQDLLNRHGEPVDANGNVWEQTTTPRFVRPDPNSDRLVDTGMFGVHVPVPDQTRVYTPPGGKQAIYRPPEEQTLANRLAIENAAKPGPTPHVDTEHFSSPVVIDPASGQARAINLPAGVTHKEKPESPEKYAYNHFVDDNGKVTLTRIGGDEATPEMWNGKAWVPMPAGAAVGPRRKDPDAGPTPAQQAAQDRAVAIQMRHANTLKNSRMKRAELDFSKAIKDLGRAPEVGLFNHDDYNNYQQNVQDAKERLLQEKQQAQDEYEQALVDLGREVQHVDFRAPASRGAQPQPAAQPRPEVPPAKPAPAPAVATKRAAPPAGQGNRQTAGGAQTNAAGQRKIASVDDLKDYARAKGVPLAQAYKEYSAQGWSIER